MDEYIEQTATNADGTPKVEKIKTPLAQIIVEQYHGKEYYDILWIDTKSWDFHIGYGSYNLEFVRKWLAEEFEIVESAADVVEVKTLEAWLYEIAMNNTNTYLCDACEEIISRLDGLRVFAKELRSHHDSLCDQTEEGEA